LIIHVTDLLMILNLGSKVKILRSKKSVGENTLSFFSALGSCVGKKMKVCFERWQKIELKKLSGEKNKKYRRVGKECPLTRCPVAIWSVCLWSPVKMVYFFLSVG